MDGPVATGGADGQVEAPEANAVDVGDITDYLAEARRRSQIANDGWRDIQDQWKADADFVSGQGQWTQAAIAQRGDERPRLTINKLPHMARQVIGDGRQNQVGIRVRPAEGDAGAGNPLRVKNMAGTRDYTRAEIMEGQVRSIEALSLAQQAYDTALEHVLYGGFGWLRVIDRYARPDGFERELVIRAVRNPLSVLPDPDAMLSDEPLFGDMKYCFVKSEIDRKLATAKWANIASFEDIPDGTLKAWWATVDTVTVAEYFDAVDVPQVYVLLSDRSVMTAEVFEGRATELQQQDIRPVMKRKGWRRDIRWTLTDGVNALEGPYLWRGSIIPIVPVLGPAVIVDGRLQFEGMFRHAWDAQRMYNYWTTAATEIVALAPKAPWIAEALSVAGYEDDYKQSDTKLVRWKFREGVPPPTRPNIERTPVAEIQMAMQASDNIKATVGLYDASLGNRSNETSGIAINARRAEGDRGTFVWHDNRNRAVARIGQILCDAIPRVYTPESIARLKTQDEAEDFVQLSVLNPATGKLEPVDLSAQRYDVAVTTGPAFATQRVEAAASMVEFMNAMRQSGNGQAVMAIADKVAAVMDWPGSDEIARRLRKMVPAELLEASEIEELKRSQKAAQPEPSPEQLAAAEVAKKESEAKLISAQADLTAAQAKLAEAQQMAPERIKDLVAEALAAIMRDGLPSQPGSMSNGSSDQASA